MNIITQDFYLRDTAEVASDLIGKFICCNQKGAILSGKIVETEGYCFKNDKASHAYRGKTKRNEAMFGPVGFAYVYFIYGNHFCFNVVAKEKNVDAGAVLIRAVEPLEGIEYMQKNRKRKDLINLTNGPGKLTQAFGITKKYNGIDLTKKTNIFVYQNRSINSNEIIATPRIGISVAQDKYWRFCLKGNKFVSR